MKVCELRVRRGIAVAVVSASRHQREHRHCGEYTQ
jgi:hypothetical protein